MTLLQLLVVLAPVQVGQAAPISVEIRPASSVSGPSFTLGEIATVTGQDKVTIKAVSDIVIGVSPLAGLSRTIFRSDVLGKLRMNQIDTSKINIVLPEGVKISRQAAEIPMQELIDAALGSLQSQLEQGVELDPKPLAFKVNVAPGARKIVAGEPKINQSSSTATVPVSIFIADKVVRCLEVSFRMMRKTKVVVATKALETGAVLTEADLKLEDLPADPNLRDPVVDPTTLVGKKLLRQAIAGKPVTSSMVKTQEAITARDTVNVESVVGGVKVSVRGVARTSGAVGETIRVLLTDGRKEVSGVIVDGSTVRLEGQP